MQSCEKESKKQKRNQEVLSRLKAIQSWRISLQSKLHTLLLPNPANDFMVIRAELWTGDALHFGTEESLLLLGWTNYTVVINKPQCTEKRAMIWQQQWGLCTQWMFLTLNVPAEHREFWEKQVLPLSHHYCPVNISFISEVQLAD